MADGNTNINTDTKFPLRVALPRTELLTYPQLTGITGRVLFFSGRQLKLQAYVA